MSYPMLLLSIAVVSQACAFCTPNSHLFAPKTFSRQNDVICEHRITHHLSPNMRKKVTSLYERPFEIRMPWDPPEPPIQQRKPRVSKKQDHDARTAERSIRKRQPRKPHNSYDLYGSSSVMDNEDSQSAMEASGMTDSKRKKRTDKPSVNQKSTQQAKLGILLIDHGSKKQSSNDALHSIADRYESILLQRLEETSFSNKASIVVRASHMELASPSIGTALSSIITQDGVTKVICVPYFLGRGRHIAIDVPNLIEDAKDALEEEGLLDQVEVVMSKHLGSDVDSMLDVVDALIKGVLSADELDAEFSWMLDQNADVTSGKDNESELRKYTNRATILENMLEKKVQQLKTMTNRVTILEDVLNKKLEENDMLRQKVSTAGGASKSLKHNIKDDADPKMLANLTSTIDALMNEKGQISNKLQALETQKVEVETEYNMSISELSTKISVLEEEVRKQNETNVILQLDLFESQQLIQVKEENEQTNTSKIYQKQINDLQSQFADLLDAYNELEQVQNETEATVVNYQSQLKDAKRENSRLIDEQSTTIEEYQRKLVKSQKEVDEEKKKSQKMIEGSRKEYEELLASKQNDLTEWRNKYNKLVVEQKNQEKSKDASDDKSIEEIKRLKHDLQQALATNTDAESTIKDLEEQLSKPRDSESNLSLEKELEQQQQLQEYLKGQIQSYYETIQEQSKELTDYKKQIDDMKQKHDDSMLIATKSVDASQLRETDLLNNIEELESELDGLQKEKDGRDQEFKALQESFDALKKDSSILQQVRGSTDDQNKLLLTEVENLRLKVDTLSMQKEHLERAIIDRVIGEDRVMDGMIAQSKPKHSRLRYLLRPWTLLRRQ